MKSARIGYSFATAIEAVLDCLANPNTSWTVLCPAKHQAKEFIETASDCVKAMASVAQAYQETFADELGDTDIQVEILRFDNGAVIRALPSNPRTARGYPGNAILDEFAHQEDSYEIFNAVARQVALGHKLRVLSTPYGEQGKFFDLAKDAGLTEGAAPVPNPILKDDWSWHWVDASMAIADGCPIDMKQMENLFKDAQAVSQEFKCVFLKGGGAYLTIELIATNEDDGATMEWPEGYEATGPIFGGCDVGRSGDRTRAVFDEVIGDVSWTRHVITLFNMPFFAEEGKPSQSTILLPWIQRCTRFAIDATGLGIGLYDYFNSKCPGKVIGMNFGGSLEKKEEKGHAIKVKTELAVGLKQQLEKRLARLPRDPQVRQELLAIKKEISGGGVKFDAPRIEVDSISAGGHKQKIYAHAEFFWAKAMARFAAAGAPAAALASVDLGREDYAGTRRGMMSEIANHQIARDRGEEVEPAMTSERRSLWR